MTRGTPYLPRGTLAEALSYPMEPSSYTRQAMVAALASVGLQRLERLLDKTGRWERDLSIDEQLLLSFVRVALQAPPWLVMDEAFGLFDDDTVELIIDGMSDKLANTGVIHIGSAGEAHSRLLRRWCIWSRRRTLRTRCHGACARPLRRRAAAARSAEAIQ